MSGLFRVAVTTVLLGALSANGQEKPWENRDLLARDRLYLTSKVYSSVNLYFAHWPERAHVWYEAAYKAYVDTALQTEKRLAFDLATLEFLAVLQNGQTFITDRWLDEQRGQPLGFSFRHLDGKWVVTASRVEGLTPGDVIASVDSQTMEDFFHQKARYIPASGEREARTRLAETPYLFPARFTLALEGGKRVEIDRARNSAPARAAPQARWIAEGETAYLRIPSFSSASEQQAIELLKQYRTARNLILDVRDSAGDYTPRQFLTALMTGPYRGWQESSPLHIGALAARGDFGTTRFDSSIRYPAPAVPSMVLFPGRVVVLVDRACRAGCEELVMPLKDARRGVLVGEATMGSAGEQYTFDFRNGIQVKVGAKRLFLPDGGAFEGVGLKPDHETPLRIEDLRQGLDPALEKAKAIANAS